MACPVHIWVPMMAGLAPFARTARDRFRAMRSERTTRGAAAPPRELKRWAPIQPHSGTDRAPASTPD